MKQKELRLSSKLAYGAADIYGGGTFLIVSIFYLEFLTRMGIPAVLAGSIPLIGKIWDAISDPIMGTIVDRTKSKYGSKRFYLLLGSFIGAITFTLLWISLSGSILFMYLFYLITFILFSTGFTIVMIPYNALLPEMIKDYHLRGQYTGVRMIFSAGSAILAGLLPNMIIRAFGAGSQIGYLYMGVFFGLLFFISIWITFWKTWEEESTQVYDAFSMKTFIQESSNVYKNKSFRYFLGIFLFGQGSADFVMILFIYFLRDVLNQNDQYTFVMAGVLVSQILAMFIFQFVLSKTSKKIPILFGFPIRILATLSMLLFAYSGAPILPIFIASFISGFGTAASSVTSFAILPDLTDVDELITSKRRPGVYSGMATFTRKIANGLAFGIVGLWLTLFGYDKPITETVFVQSDLTIQGIKYAFIFFPLVFMFFSLWFTYKFPMDKKEFDVVKKEIARRKGLDSSVITPEEIKICEHVTGYSYPMLWGQKDGNHS
jgi:oligogalacturonide transporter